MATKPAKKKNSKRSKKAPSSFVSLTPEGAELLRRANADPEIERLKEVGANIAASAQAVVSAAEKIIGSEDPARKQLHRKVVLLVYDAAGERMTSADWDLKDDDDLLIEINSEKGVSSQIGTTTR